MRLADEVCEQLQAFIAGDLAPHELAGWLDSVADEIDAEDPAIRHLAGQTYTLLAEMGYGDRTAENARTEVAALLRHATSPNGHGSGEPDTIIPGSVPRS